MPRRISYDNSKVAVAKIIGTRERQLTREFLRLQSHFLFEEHFCLVRRPQEKGHVEGLVEYGRRNFLVPVPRIGDLSALNDQLAEKCRCELQRHLRGKSDSKGNLLLDDQKHFRLLPEEDFEARRVTVAHADSLALVRFDKNSYSVPTKYAHRPITVTAGVDDVRLVFEDQLIAVHPRCWKKERFAFNPVHYLALLERKPGGFDFAKPLEAWDLPVCFGILRRRLEAEAGGRGTREFIRVLRLLERHSLNRVKRAVQYGLEIGATDSDALRLILESQNEEPIGLFSLEGRPHLKLVQIEQTDVSCYQSLLLGG